MGLALKETGGKLYTIEKRDYKSKIAKEYFEKANISYKIFEEDIEVKDERIICQKPEKSFIDTMNKLHHEMPSNSIVTYLKGHSEFYTNCFESLLEIYNTKRHIRAAISCQDRIFLTSDSGSIYGGEKSANDIIGIGGITINDGEFTIDQFSHISDICKGILWHDIKNPEDNFMRTIAHKYSIFPIQTKTGFSTYTLKII
jgi:hypothetical protein